MVSSDYRERARSILSGKWGIAIMVTFIASLLGGLATGGGNSLDLEAEELARLPEAIRNVIVMLMGGAAILGFIQFIIGGVVELGYSRFLLNLHDDQEAGVSDLFSQFDRFADGFCLALLRALFVALWSLLLVIPGIVASYGYSMAGFLMTENPNMTATEALRASKELMRGHKFELFCLDISFIGWAILAVFTLGIGGLWLTPYENASRAAFYRELVGQKVTVE